MNDKKNKKQQVAELEEKIAFMEEEVLRAKADLINYRKRKDEEVSSLLKYGNADLILSILNTIDNFERALQVKEDDLTAEMKNFLVGFKMTYQLLKETLEAYGVKEISCLHEKFDSNLQSCVYTENNPDFEDEIVLEVILKGYTYFDKVLRHASVKVNKIGNNSENENIEKEKENEENE